jgi:phosphoglycolate phosphatase
LPEAHIPRNTDPETDHTMTTYNTILFDLDGTLTDPSLEMIRAAEHALQQLGIVEHDTERLKAFTVEPLLQCFEQQYGMSHERADQAFAHFWSYASSFGPALNLPYAPVSAMLETLHQREILLCVATARNTRNANQILRANKFDGYFSHVFGTTDDDHRRSKRMVIFDLLCELDEAQRAASIMVGDRVGDIVAAADNGIDSLAVGFGQESIEQLTSADPTYLVHTPEAMADFLQSHCP